MTPQATPRRIVAGGWGYDQRINGGWTQIYRHATTHAYPSGYWEYTGHSVDTYEDAWSALRRLQPRCSDQGLLSHARDVQDLIS